VTRKNQNQKRKQQKTKKNKHKFMTQTEYKIGDTVTCVNIEPLEGNEIAPPLELHKDYPIVGFTHDNQGNQHLDVGIVSEYNYIRSFETKEELPNDDKIHWCHPSRFIQK